MYLQTINNGKTKLNLISVCSLLYRVNDRKILKQQTLTLCMSSFAHTPESAELVRVAKLMLLMGDWHVRSMRCYQMKIFHSCDRQ